MPLGSGVTEQACFQIPFATCVSPMGCALTEQVCLEVQATSGRLLKDFTKALEGHPKV